MEERVTVRIQSLFSLPPTYVQDRVGSLMFSATGNKLAFRHVKQEWAEDSCRTRTGPSLLWCPPSPGSPSRPYSSANTKVNIHLMLIIKEI